MKMWQQLDLISLIDTLASLLLAFVRMDGAPVRSVATRSLIFSTSGSATSPTATTVAIAMVATLRPTSSPASFEKR